MGNTVERDRVPRAGVAPRVVKGVPNGGGLGEGSGVVLHGVRMRWGPGAHGIWLWDGL